MAMDMVRQLSNSSLPATFRTAAEIDKIKLLRAAGLVIALTPAPSNEPTLSGTTGVAQVLAITEKGHEELASFPLPADAPPLQPARASWWKSKLNAAVNARRATGWR
jgi:hypothetical protein